MTVAELYAGVGEGKERTALDNFITAFEIIPIQEVYIREIMAKIMELVQLTL